MKITKRQLRRIIKEETELLKEVSDEQDRLLKYILYGAILNRDSPSIEGSLDDLEKTGVDIGALSTAIENLAHGRWTPDIRNAIASSKK